jgi:hypothetical protein
LVLLASSGLVCFSICSFCFSILSSFMNFLLRINLALKGFCICYEYKALSVLQLKENIDILNSHVCRRQDAYIFLYPYFFQR